MGVPSHTQRSIFSGLAAILHMSSIEIWEDTDDDGNSVAKLDPCSAHFVHASRLLQVSTHALQQGLCTQSGENGGAAQNTLATVQANATC